MLCKHLQSALKKTEKRAAGEERASTREECLAGRNQTPGDHLNRDPSVRSQLFRDQLRRKLCKQEAEIEYSLSGVVVIRVQPKIIKHII